MEPIVSEYTSSMRDDARIFHPTIQVNIAHTIMLAERDIIQKDDAAALLRALRNLYKGGISKLDIKPELEDIHMAVEEFVTKETGEKIERVTIEVNEVLTIQPYLKQGQRKKEADQK